MIAQDLPAEGLSYGLFEPLLLAAVLYAILFLASRVLEGRGDQRGQKLADVAFVLLLLMGVYVVVLTVTALVNEAELFGDMLVTTAVITAFFLLLIVLLLVLAENGIGGISSLRRRRSRRRASSSRG